MDIQGQWALELGTNMGLTPAGIIIFKSGRIVGGDSNHFYTGYYQIEPNDHINGSMEITNFKEEPISIFGKEAKYSVRLKGSYHVLQSDKSKRFQMILDSFLNDNPHHMVRLICEKQCAVNL